MFLRTLALLALFTTPLAAAPLAILGTNKDAPHITSVAAKVAVAMHAGYAVLTLMPQSEGASDIALLIPVMGSLSREQIHIGDMSVFDALDGLSSPRLVEAFDANPCNGTGATEKTVGAGVRNTAVDAQYTFDILNAVDAAKLPAWLAGFGYVLPEKAERLLQPYAQNFSFLLARAKLPDAKKTFLRPIQIAFNTQRLLLPIRLGLMNAPEKIAPMRKGHMPDVPNAAPDLHAQPTAPENAQNDISQDMTLYVLTQTGRAETSPMRSLTLTDARNTPDLPAFVKDDFNATYDTLLRRRASAENAAMLEFSGAATLPAATLKQLGATWYNEAPQQATNETGNPNAENLIGGYMLPKNALPKSMQRAAAPSSAVFLTRLHLRYTAATLPYDLDLSEGTNRESYVAQFATRVPFTDSTQATCPLFAQYQQSVLTRQQHELENLSRLTGIPANKLQPPKNQPADTNWWKGLWD